jgi:hypothetical protein
MVRTDLTVDLVIQIKQVPWDLWKYSEYYEDGNLFSVNRPQLLKLLVHMLFQKCIPWFCTNVEMINKYIFLH